MVKFSEPIRFLVIFLEGSLNCLADFYSQNDGGLPKQSHPGRHEIPAGEFIELGRFRVYRASWVHIDKTPEDVCRRSHYI